MRDYIRRRVIDVGHYIAETRSTVRQAAAVFDVSKSTIHKDITERLPGVDKELAKRVKKVLEINKAERHIRGGEATRLKYIKQRRARMKQSGKAEGKPSDSAVPGLHHTSYLRAQKD